MQDPKQIIEKALKDGRKFLLEPEAKSLCVHYSISVPKFMVVNDLESAIKAAHELGYPVVLKVVSPDIIHKSDVGGVILNINSEEELKEAYERLIDNVRQKAPHARILGVLIEEQVPKSVEVIIGVTKDPQFGHVIMFGLGGIFVEVLEDVTFRILPINKKDALEMISEIKGYSILKGYRGRAGVDINAIADIMVKVSRIVMENPMIRELDLNPVMVYERGAKVVDARIILNEYVEKTGG